MSKGYYTHTRVTDFGPYVTKIVLPMPAPVKAACAGGFSVYVQRMDEKGEPLRRAQGVRGLCGPGALLWPHVSAGLPHIRPERP